MMGRLRMAGLAALAFLIGVPVIGAMMGLEFAVIIVLMIAVIGFFTIVFVMIVGSEHDHYPVEAKDSAAVTAWSERAAARQSQQAEATVEEASGEA